MNCFVNVAVRRICPSRLAGAGVKAKRDACRHSRQSPGWRNIKPRRSRLLQPSAEGGSPYLRHMNVLPLSRHLYDRLMDMDDINGDFPRADACDRRR